ncbi:MAG: hypothetical protein ACO1O6_10640 [Bacteroidota bacterium]
MNPNQDYVFYESGMMMNSRQPMKQMDVAVVGTKNYVFFVPKKTVGLFFVLNTIKTHQYFAGVSIEDGVRKLVSEASSVDELEKSMIALLEDDEKYVYEVGAQKSFKFRGFLGKHSLRTSTGGTNWSSVTVNGKGKSKEMRAFYGQ